MFPEELLKGAEQLGEIQASVLDYIPGDLLRDAGLGNPGQGAWDDLPVDGVGDLD